MLLARARQGREKDQGGVLLCAQQSAGHAAFNNNANLLLRKKASRNRRPTRWGKDVGPGQRHAKIVMQTKRTGASVRSS